MWHNVIRLLSNSENVSAYKVVRYIVSSSKLVQLKVIGIDIEIEEARYGR